MKIGTSLPFSASVSLGILSRVVQLTKLFRIVPFRSLEGECKRPARSVMLSDALFHNHQDEDLMRIVGVKTVAKSVWVAAALSIEKRVSI